MEGQDNAQFQLATKGLSMRIVFWMSFLSTISAIVLTVFCFIQIPVQKVPTQTALVIVDKQFINRSQLNLQQIDDLEFTIGNIRRNDYVFRITHTNLWSAGVFGFIFLAVLNLIITILTSRAMRSLNSKSKISHVS
jgi:hypothetical protein